MSKIKQNGSSSIIAGAIILGAIIIGVFIYIGLQKPNNNINQTQAIQKTMAPTDTTKTTTDTNINSSNKTTKQENNISDKVNNQKQNNEPKQENNISDKDQLKQELLQKTNIPENKLKFDIADNTGQIARGTVKNKDDQGGAMWFATKTQGKWKVTFVGQGVPKCTELNPYNYPTSWADYCVNSQDKVVAR